MIVILNNIQYDIPAQKVSVILTKCHTCECTAAESDRLVIATNEHWETAALQRFTPSPVGFFAAEWVNLASFGGASAWQIYIDLFKTN